MDNQRRIQKPVQHLRWRHFAIIVNCIQTLTIFAKHFVLDIFQSYKYASNKTKQNPGVLSLFSQKIKTEISANSFHFEI